MAQYNGTAKEWVDLSAQALNPLGIYYKPEINSSTVQDDRNGTRARISTGGKGDRGGQGGRGATGQAKVTYESQADVSAYGFWKWGTSTIFYIRIVNLDASSYLRQTSVKALETAEKDKKDKYPQPCLDCRRTFISVVYSTDIISSTEAVAAQQLLALLLSNKLKQEYLEMCGFARAGV